MAELAYPFDAGTGSIVTEDDWSKMASTWQDDGIIQGDYYGNTLVVYSNSELNKVHLGTGSAYVKGFRYENTADLVIAFATNSSGLERRDRVVLRLDKTANTVRAILIQGTPGASPAPLPALANSATAFDIPLAQITVANGATTVASANIVYDYTVVGKRILSQASLTGLPNGSVSYNPVDGEFYSVSSLGNRVVAQASRPSKPMIACTSTTRPPHSSGQWIYETDTKITYVSDGTNWTVPIGMLGYRRKTGNSTIANTTTLLADPDLQIPVLASASYVMTGRIIYNNTLATETIGIGITGPAMFSIMTKARHTPPGGGAETTFITANSPPMTISVGVAGAAPVWNVMELEQELFVQTAGTMAMTYQNLAATTTTIVRQGSYLRLERIT